jgi:D-alanyl-D-alanine carboxypeptidase
VKAPDSLRWLALLCLVLATVGCGAPPSEPSDSQTELQAIVDKYVEPDGPAVNVRVESPTVGDVTAHQGLADVVEDTPLRDSDRFRIGSVSKSFVAVIMLQLAEEELLSLDDPAADYLPDEIVERIANVDQVTIRQLLNHTSGIDDYYETDEFQDAIGADQSEHWTPEEALTYVYDLPALFAVGKRHSYSNSNYLLLQMIIEEVGEQPWGAELKARIAEPLDLKDTYVEHFETRRGGIVRSYADKTDYWKDVTNVDDGTGLADGGVITTTAELATYMQALISGEALLSEQSRKEMQDWIDDGDGDLYGLGLAAFDYGDDGMLIGHSGSAAGFGAEMWFDTESKSTIVILFASDDLQDAVEDDLFDAVDTWASKQ